MTAQVMDRLLDNCPMFRGFTRPELEEIVGLVETKQYTPGQTIIEEGQQFQFIWILMQGKCQVVKNRPAGGEQELSVLDPGGVFGEMSFFNPAPHSATVRATTDVEVFRLSRDKYDMLLRVGSLAAYKLALNTVGVLSDRLRRMDEWACNRVETGVAAHHEEWLDFQSKLYSGWQF